MENFFEENKKIIEFLYYALINNGCHIRGAIKGSLLYRYEINKTRNEFVYYVSIKRNDYINFIESALKKITSKSEINVKYKKGINFKNIYYLLNFFRFKRYAKEYLCTLKKYTITNKEMLYIFLNLLRLKSIRKKLKNVDCDVFVVLGDAWIEENMMVNYFNSIGKKTVTLQHGLFIDNIDEEKYDKLNYINVPSKYELCWGDYTYEMIKRYNPNVISYICGNPTVNLKIQKNFDFGYIGIIFDNLSLQEYNSKMLNLVMNYAKQHKLKVKIRIHPTDLEKNYHIDSEICEFDKNIDDCFLLIGHTSSMLITYMFSGNKVLKYKTEIKSIPYDSKIVFSNESELKNVLLNIEKFDYYGEAKRFISYCSEESVYNYTKILDKIHGDL